jgi:hypothetical protein
MDIIRLVVKVLLCNYTREVIVSPSVSFSNISHRLEAGVSVSTLFAYRTNLSLCHLSNQPLGDSLSAIKDSWEALMITAQYKERAKENGI